MNTREEDAPRQNIIKKINNL